jgi:hypothetical protein
MKILRFLTLPLIAFSLCSCTTYSSKYKAIVLITNNTKTKSSMRFGDFTGRYVFKMQKTSDGEGAIQYHATLGQGNITVSYVISGRESVLFTISDGETLDSFGGYIEKGNRVQIVVTSEGNAHEGEFTFTFTN